MIVALLWFILAALAIGNILLGFVLEALISLPKRMKAPQDVTINYTKGSSFAEEIFKRRSEPIPKADPPYRVDFYGGN